MVYLPCLPVAMLTSALSLLRTFKARDSASRDVISVCRAGIVQHPGLKVCFHMPVSLISYAGTP